MSIIIACPICGIPLRCTVLTAESCYGGDKYVSRVTGCACLIGTASWARLESEALLHAAAILAAVH